MSMSLLGAISHTVTVKDPFSNLALTFNMRKLIANALMLPLAAKAVNVVLSNDDGWAEKNIRVFYDTLTAAGDSVVLSAPAENESGTGTL